TAINRFWGRWFATSLATETVSVRGGATPSSIENRDQTQCLRRPLRGVAPPRCQRDSWACNRTNPDRLVSSSRSHRCSTRDTALAPTQEHMGVLVHVKVPRA